MLVPAAVYKNPPPPPPASEPPSLHPVSRFGIVPARAEKDLHDLSLFSVAAIPVWFPGKPHASHDDKVIRIKSETFDKFEGLGKTKTSWLYHFFLHPGGVRSVEELSLIHI